MPLVTCGGVLPVPALAALPVAALATLVVTLPASSHAFSAKCQQVRTPAAACWGGPAHEWRGALLPEWPDF